LTENIEQASIKSKEDLNYPEGILKDKNAEKMC